MFDIKEFRLISSTDAEIRCADILKDELSVRCNVQETGNPDAFSFVFRQDTSLQNEDCYRVSVSDNEIVFTASGIRGLIYAIGLFLRKCEYSNSAIHLTKDITGEYAPYMSIRGHQLGWRTTANSYEAWTVDEYIQYIKELMFFGCNVFEHVVGDKSENKLMKYGSQLEFIQKCNVRAKELGIDISYWYPHSDNSLEESTREREEFFSSITGADIYFPPGSDPGDYEAKESLARAVAAAKAARKHHPELKLFPSAQSPDGFGKWGDTFIEEMNSLPEDIDGIITGPNCAMPLHDLRKRLPIRYPIRLYPDITHNVRCEYPVHFSRDDWHYALTSTLSRESINPRPTEYRTIHRLTRQYVVGSVSYSEGISDDVNKFVWSDMDFFPDVALTETLSDYARLFFPSADTKAVVNGILGLEKNWEGDPAENPHIEATHAIFKKLLSDNPELYGNVRFLMCLFRADCDLLVRKRRANELELIEKAKYFIFRDMPDEAERILSQEESAECKALREEISEIGRRLFEKAGLQLNVADYCANGWERGATLDTIDNPVTDKAYLLNRLEFAKSLGEEKRAEFMKNLLNFRKTAAGEYYFSFAENSFTELGIPQEPYFYMDYQGDNPSKNNGSMPMSMLKVFDHYSFRMKTGGLTEGSYKLILNIKPRYRDEVTDFTLKINGHIIHHGKQYGGVRDETAEKYYSAPGFEMQSYNIPGDIIENGCIELEITEPLIGIMISEIFIKKVAEK